MAHSSSSTKDYGQSTAEKAKETAGQYADKAKETASQFADKAKETAGNVADKAKDFVGQMGDKTREAASAVGDMASNAASNVGKSADKMASSAGSSVQHFADTIKEKGPHGGVLGDATRAVADTIHEGGKYLEQEGLSGMMDDVTNVIRRNPLPAVLVGIGLGFLIGRTLGNS